MAIFLGLHSSLIYFVSSCSWSSLEASSVVLCASFSATRIPTPPPLLLDLGLWIHLYPLIDICSPFFSCVSVMRAIDIFSVFRAVSRLRILPLIPLTLMVAMVISLFFLILGLRLFFWSCCFCFFCCCFIGLCGSFLLAWFDWECCCFFLWIGVLWGVWESDFPFFHCWSRLPFGWYVPFGAVIELLSGRGSGLFLVWGGRLPFGRGGRLPFCGRVGRLPFCGRGGRLPFCGRGGRLPFLSGVVGCLFSAGVVGCLFGQEW